MNTEPLNMQLVSCYRRADWDRFKNFLNGNVVVNNSSLGLLNPGDIDRVVGHCFIHAKGAPNGFSLNLA
jgi:hypothetical protein